MLVAKSLRRQHCFAGYIHLKTIPEASPWLIEQAGLWADRLSINIEIPSQQGLKQLAPEKNAQTITHAMGQMRERIVEAKEERRRFSPAGQSTQMIVGADATNDAQVLETSNGLYRTYALRRVYYSRLQPDPGGQRDPAAESSALAAREPALSSGLAAALLRLQRGRDRQRWRRRYAGSGDRSQARLGAEEPRAFSGRRQYCRSGAAVARAGLGVRAVDRILEVRRHTKLGMRDLARLTTGIRRLRPFLIAADHSPLRLIDRSNSQQPVRPHCGSGAAIGSILMEPVHISLEAGADLDGFRTAVRRLIALDIAPERVIWSRTDIGDMFGAAPGLAETPVTLPRSVADLVTLVVCHKDPERYALLYRLIWRIHHCERALLEIASDPLVHRLSLMAKTIRRDIHKMHAFLRFREVQDPDGTERYVAWFEPEHSSWRRRRRSSSAGSAISSGRS